LREYRGEVPGCPGGVGAYGRPRSTKVNAQCDKQATVVVGRQFSVDSTCDGRRSADELGQLIALSVYICVQHDADDGPSATADVVFQRVCLVSYRLMHGERQCAENYSK